MLPQEGRFAIMLQETESATRAQEMQVAAALWDKWYTPFFSSWLAEMGATSASRGGGRPTAVSSKYVAEHDVVNFTEIVPGKAAALEIRTDRGGLTLINVHGPQAGCSPWAGQAAFWADIQMYATARTAPGGHRRRHQRIHGCHHQRGHEKTSARAGSQAVSGGPQQAAWRT